MAEIGIETGEAAAETDMVEVVADVMAAAVVVVAGLEVEDTGAAVAMEAVAVSRASSQEVD